jgi:RimJ/RimL family protein N-acetyltransferase
VDQARTATRAGRSHSAARHNCLALVPLASIRARATPIAVDQVLRTDRLILRRWRDSDREPFAEMNADPRVMELLPGLLSKEESDLLIGKFEAHFNEHGYGKWAVELRRDSRFIGYVGCSIVTFDAFFTPCVEIGWRLSHDSWGQGLATEGAREAMRHVFEQMRVPSLVSFTVPANVRSRRVMEKLEMTHDAAEDFDYPLLREGHPLRRHVLYRLER